jgi:hypothetical protein
MPRKPRSNPGNAGRIGKQMRDKTPHTRLMIALTLVDCAAGFGCGSLAMVSLGECGRLASLGDVARL